MLSMSRIYDTDIILRDGLAEQPGIYEHRRGTVLARTDRHIAVKWPRGKTYQRNGGRSPPYPPRAMVYRVNSAERRMVAGREVEVLEVEHIIDWSMGRRLSG